MSTNFFRRFTKTIFIIINIVVALFFLLGCYGSWIHSGKFWFVGLFTLASLYFLVALVAFFFFWVFANRKLALISLVSIVVAWGPVKQMLPLRLSANFTMQKHPANIRVMSWNVEHFDILEHKSHPEIKREMIDVINNYQPDVACFQEMVASDSLSVAINYIPDFMKKMGMEDYHFSYNRKLDFDRNHHFGIITFSRYPIIDKHTFSYAPNDYNSIFQFVDIVKEGDTFRVFNIHLQSLKFSNSNLSYIDQPSLKDEQDVEKSKNLLAKFKIGFLKRRAQSDHIKEEMKKSPYPVIVCGDFNDVPNSYAYHTIGRDMKNAFAEKGAGIGRTFYGISPTLRIDNVFCDSKFDVEQYARVKKKMSDHFPIIADLYFKKE